MSVADLTMTALVRRRLSPQVRHHICRDFDLDNGWSVRVIADWTLESREDGPEVTITHASLRTLSREMPMELRDFDPADLRYYTAHIVDEVEALLDREDGARMFQDEL